LFVLLQKAAGPLLELVNAPFLGNLLSVSPNSFKGFQASKRDSDLGKEKEH
jgi:hypothetical protein